MTGQPDGRWEGPDDRPLARSETGDGAHMALADSLRAWLEEQRSQLQPQTWQGYHGVVERYLVPALGEVALSPRSRRASYRRCMPRCRTAAAARAGG